MAPPKRKYKKRARRRNDPALLARIAAVRSALRSLHAQGAADTILADHIGISRNTMMRWCSEGYADLHIQTKLLATLEGWISSGCPIPGWTPKAPEVVPTAEELTTSAARNKTQAAMLRNDFPTLSEGRLRRLLRGAGIHTEGTQQQQRPGCRFKNWIRHISTWRNVPPAYFKRALLAGYITEDRKLTEEGVRFCLRPEDIKWLLGQRYHVAPGPQLVDSDHLHPRCGAWMVQNGVCTASTRNTLILTEFGRRLREEYTALAMGGIDGQ